MEKILKIDRFIYSLEKIFVFILLGLMLLLSFFQIIMRIFFSGSFAEIDIFIRQFVMIGCLFASSIATYHSSHFRIEVFEKFTSEKLKKIIFIISQLSVSAASFILFIKSFEFIENEFAEKMLSYKKILNDIIHLNFSSEYMLALLPLVFLNMIIHSISNIIKPR